jgi:asparagine synthase (glutamine-hydrolysing)
MSLDFKAKQFLRGLPFETARRNQAWLGAFLPEEQRSLLHPDLVHQVSGFDPYNDMDEMSRDMHFRDEIDRLIFLYSKFYMAEDILTKVDRASMAVSLEVRSPFLDVDLIEFINRMPSHLKIRGLNRKYILKKALSRVLPERVLNRKKKGFGIPLARWFKDELKDDLRETLHPDRLESDNLFRPEAINKMISKHLNGSQDNRKQLFTLYVFQKWKENTLDKAIQRPSKEVLQSARSESGEWQSEEIRQAASG